MTPQAIRSMTILCIISIIFGLILYQLIGFWQMVALYFICTLISIAEFAKAEDADENRKE